MTILNYIFQISLIIIPAAAVLITTIYFIRKYNFQEQLNNTRTFQSELKKQRQEFFLPNRTEAYQRAILLMERIHPNSLIMRSMNPGLPAAAFQTKLLQTIREEYEHNVAQQLFISIELWEMVKNSKEETIKIINIAGKQMGKDAFSHDLASKIFELVAEIGELPTEITVKALKEDFQKLF